MDLPRIYLRRWGLSTWESSPRLIKLRLNNNNNWTWWPTLARAKIAIRRFSRISYFRTRYSTSNSNSTMPHTNSNFCCNNSKTMPISSSNSKCLVNRWSHTIHQTLLNYSSNYSSKAKPLPPRLSRKLRCTAHNKTNNHPPNNRPFHNLGLQPHIAPEEKRLRAEVLALTLKPALKAATKHQPHKSPLRRKLPNLLNPLPCQSLQALLRLSNRHLWEQHLSTLRWIVIIRILRLDKYKAFSNQASLLSLWVSSIASSVIILWQLKLSVCPNWINRSGTICWWTQNFFRTKVKSIRTRMLSLVRCNGPRCSSKVNLTSTSRQPKTSTPSLRLWTQTNSSSSKPLAARAKTINSDSTRTNSLKVSLVNRTL